jgi:hypothetical protein
MMTNAYALLDEEIGAADIIEAWDRKHPFWSLVLWFCKTPKCIRPYPAGPYRTKVVDVEIDRNNVEEQNRLRERIWMVKSEYAR